MPSPEISFASSEEQLQYATNVLVEAGFTPEQIDRIRTKVGAGPGKIPYTQELTGQRRYMVQELLAARLSNRQISEVLLLSKETVSSDRIHNRQLWTNEILKSQDTWRARLVQEQNELKEKALIAFEASKTKRTTTIKEGAEGALVRIEEGPGESSFLSVARSCLEQQAKLIGLFDIKPQIEDNKNGYKNFLDTLSKEVKKIKQAERNSNDRAGAVEAEAIEPEFDEDGQPVGDSRPLLPANEDLSFDA
jgi:hypothetical protein